MCMQAKNKERERGREERTNERTILFINEGNEISTILFFIQPSGETTTTKTRKIKRGGEREGGRGSHSLVRLKIMMPLPEFDTKITQHALKVSVFKQSSSWTDTVQKRHRERERNEKRREAACARLKELSSRERERERGGGGGGAGGGGHFSATPCCGTFSNCQRLFKCHPGIFCHHVPKRSLAARFVTPSPKYHYNLSSLFPRCVCVLCRQCPVEPPHLQKSQSLQQHQKEVVGEGNSLG